LLKDRKLQEAAKQEGLNVPVVLIGVHAAGLVDDEIEKIVAKYELQSPICIDEASPQKPFGAFFEKCRVRRLPYAIAVDQDGTVLSHGTLTDAIIAAYQRARR
jgi:hypothetical protein